MRVLRFLLVGGVNTLLGIFVYGILLRIGVHYSIASGVSLAIGIVVGFQAHRRLVFQSHGLFVRYLAVWVCIYGLANVLIWILARWMGAFLAGVAAMPLNAAVAFLALRHFVFTDQTSGGPDSISSSASCRRNPLGPPSD